MRRRRCISWVPQASEGSYEVANCLPLCFQCAEQENEVARKIAALGKANVRRTDYSDVKASVIPMSVHHCTERGRLGKSRKSTLTLSTNKLIPLHFPEIHICFFLYHKTSNLYRGICIRESSLLEQIPQAKICFFQALTRNWRPELWLLLPSSYRDRAMFAVGPGLKHQQWYHVRKGKCSKPWLFIHQWSWYQQVRKHVNMFFYFGGWMEKKGDEKGYFQCYLYPRNGKNIF